MNRLMNRRTGAARRRTGWALGLLAAAVLAYLWLAGYLNNDARTRFAATGAASPLGAVYVSGDAGLRFGLGPVAAKALAAHGVPVLGFNTPALFRFHRSRAEVGAIVADMVRQGLHDTGRDRLVVIGQSYGADILGVGLSALPADLRAHVAAIILVVPGRDVFFRADPSGLAYHGAPDADGRASVRALGWGPLTCIYGQAESDSACPGLTGRQATAIAMPGGHFLHHDSDALVAHVLAAVAHVTGPN